MRALANLIIASAALALLSAPASAASGRVAKVEQSAATAQQACVGWGVHCDPEVLAEYCIAADKCATALPASTLLSYDARMDAAAAAR